MDIETTSRGIVDRLNDAEIESIRRILNTDSIYIAGCVGGGVHGDIEPSPSAPCGRVVAPLSPLEIERIRHLLQRHGHSRRVLFQGQQQQQRHQQPWQQAVLEAKSSVDSDQTEFRQSTHAWCVSHKKEDASGPAGLVDRIIGGIIIGFQMFTYYL